MNNELFFSIINTMVLPQWLLMIVAPKWKWTQKLVQSFLIPILLSISYIAFLFMAEGIDFSDFSQLSTLQELFTNPVMVLGGWAHYLAFDLVVGSWILSDSQKLGIKHYWIIPCLFFCFMLGPVGFLLYQIIKRFYPSKT